MSEQHIEKLLVFLGVPTDRENQRYCCPLHTKRNHSLFFAESTILPGGYRVKCDDPKCGFAGTVFELMSKSTGEPLSEIFNKFMPDGEFYDTFIAKSRNTTAYRAEVVDNLESIGINNDHLAYLKKCNQDLLLSAPLRSMLSDIGVRESMFEKLTVGLYQRGSLPDTMPQPSRETSEDKLLLPYTCHGKVVELQTLNSKDKKSRKHITINDELKYAGIFQEDLLSGEGVVNVCQNELMAMLLASKIDEYTLKPSNAVFMAENKATSYLHDGQPIRLISSEDHLLDLYRAIHFWKKRNERDVYVVEIPGRMASFSGSRLKIIMDNHEKAEDWIVENILSMNREKSLTELKSVLASLSLSREDKSALVALLRDSGKADTILLSLVKDAKTSGSTISYGKFVFKRTDTCYTAGGVGNKRLSSCVFYADAVTSDESGDKILIGRIKTNLPNEPLYRVSLPTKKLLTTQGSKVGELVWSQLKEQGSQYKPYFADLYGGPTWFNLLEQFDDTHYIDKLLGLGLQGDKVINFPNARVDVQTGTTLPGHPLTVIQGEAVAMYSQVANGTLDREALKKLLESDNKLVKRTILILCHILHQVATSSIAGIRYVPKHLIIPYTVDDDVWYNAFIQAYFILSGRQRPPITPDTTMTDFGNFSNVNKQLGTLPGLYLCRLSKYLKDWMYGSDNSVVLLTQCMDTTPLSKEKFTYFASDEDTEVLSRDYLDEEVAEILRMAIPKLILNFSEKVEVRSDCGPSILPMEKGLRWLLEETGARMSADDVVIKPHYTIKGKNSLDLFLSLVSDEVLSHKVSLASTYREYKADSSSYVGYYSKDHLFLKVSKCLESLGSVGNVFSSTHLMDQAERCVSGEMKLDRAAWNIHYMPDRGKALTLRDLKIVKAG